MHTPSSKRLLVLWLIFLITTCLQLVGSFGYFVLLENEIAIQITYLTTKATILLVPLALIYAGFPLPKFSLKPNLKKSILLGLGSGLAIAVLILATYFLYQGYFEQFSAVIFDKVVEVGILKIYWPVVICIALFHSLFEEYYVRWYLVNGFKTKFSPLLAILIGNALFTVHHYIILSQFVSWPMVIFLGTFVGIGGCIWSYIYHKTDSLLGAWISHMCADIAIFIIGYLLIT